MAKPPVYSKNSPAPAVTAPVPGAVTTTGSSIPYAPPAAAEGPDWGKTTGYLLLRLLLAIMLLQAGVEKFKSTDSPYYYNRANWHDEKTETGEVSKPGRWRSVSLPVYEFGGFNNAAVFQIDAFGERSGEKISNFISHVFYWYAQTLPYLMIFAGALILFGLFNRFALFLGGAIWLSLAAGQMTLPDNQTVFMLSQFVLMYALAASLLRYNRFAITRF